MSSCQPAQARRPCAVTPALTNAAVGSGWGQRKVQFTGVDSGALTRPLTVTQTPEEPVDDGEQPFSFRGGEPSALVKGLQRNRTIRIYREFYVLPLYVDSSTQRHAEIRHSCLTQRQHRYYIYLYLSDYPPSERERQRERFLVRNWLVQLCRLRSPTSCHLQGGDPRGLGV